MFDFLAKVIVHDGETIYDSNEEDDDDDGDDDMFDEDEDEDDDHVEAGPASTSPPNSGRILCL